MPGLAYGIPAADCLLGKYLRQKRGSVCGKCYAHKGMYVFPVVREAQAKRRQILLGDMDTWAENMAELIARKLSKKESKDRVFRWHDSGDLQSLEHLSAIVWIAKQIPSVKFWLPTKERKMVQDWQKANGTKFPANLVVRVSAAMIHQRANPLPGTVASTVESRTGRRCPAPTQGNACLDCRACWDKRVKSVDYALH